MSVVDAPSLEHLATDPDALPSSPGVAMEVLRLIEAEDCDVSKLERTLETDPALTARVLRLANSAHREPRRLRPIPRGAGQCPAPPRAAGSRSGTARIG